MNLRLGGFGMTLKARAAGGRAFLSIAIGLASFSVYPAASAAVAYPGDSFKKITSAPSESSGKEDDAIIDEHGHLVQSSPASRRGDVEVLPAPGVSELTRGHAPASTSEPETATKTEPAGHDEAPTHEPASVKAPAVKVETKPAPAVKAEAAAASAHGHESHEAHEAAKEPVAEAHEAAPVAAKVEAPRANQEAVQSLKWLTNGNTRFVKKANRADGRSPADRKRLASGASPHAIILSCSDSRVPPELIFDQALGEIVTIRVAGEALDSSVIASIEAELHGKGPKLLVVMGHTNCSTVDAAVHYKEGQSAGSEFLDKAINEIRPHLKTANSEHPSQDLTVESTLVADGTARELVKRSEMIRHKVETGELIIKTALYRLDSGKVTFY